MQDNELGFNEPWEAHSLAIVNALIGAGYFTNKEWSDALNKELLRMQEAGGAVDGSKYYYNVINALEELVSRKNYIDKVELISRKNDWYKSYQKTPHGEPIQLKPTK